MRATRVARALPQNGRIVFLCGGGGEELLAG